MKVKLKLTEEEAILLKGVLSREAFNGSWYRRKETDMCSALYKRLSAKLAEL